MLIYLCPADKKYGCTWEGVSDDIFLHFSQEHEDLLYLKDTVTISLDVQSENRLLLVNSEIYLLQTKISNNNNNDLQIYLRYLGPAQIAANLTYNIDIEIDGKILQKNEIEVIDGSFRISRECIQSNFGDVDEINCRISVSGYFDYDDQCVGNISGSITNLNKLFSTPEKEGNSPIQYRTHRDVFDEPSKISSFRSSWCGTDKLNYFAVPSTAGKMLKRSLTFSSEELKKINVMKRQASVRSLISIVEYSDLNSVLKCSNCEDHLAAPIFLCISKHNICSNCFRENKLCRKCNKEITVEKNLQLEAKCYNYSYSCINSKYGCTEKFLYPMIIHHEINCKFCQYSCPMKECQFKGPYKQILSHFSLIHSSVKIIQSFIAVFQKHRELFLVNENLGIFYCHCIQNANEIVWKVKYSGPKERKFFYELKFKGKNFKNPLLLTRRDDYYALELSMIQLKEMKVKAKHSILTITR